LHDNITMEVSWQYHIFVFSDQDDTKSSDITSEIVSAISRVKLSMGFNKFVNLGHLCLYVNICDNICDIVCDVKIIISQLAQCVLQRVW
jgi:hypothetical protein